MSKPKYTYKLDKDGPWDDYHTGKYTLLKDGAAVSHIDYENDPDYGANIEWMESSQKRQGHATRLFNKFGTLVKNKHPLEEDSALDLGWAESKAGHGLAKQLSEGKHGDRVVYTSPNQIDEKRF
jgi:hypothetical protein